MEVIGLKKSFLTALILIALLAGACGDGDGPGPIADYFPLATGSFWEFDLSGTGTLDSFDIVASGTLAVTVGAQDTLDNGMIAFEVNSESIMIFDIGQGMYSDTTVDLETFYWYESGDQISEYEALDDTTGLLIHSPPIEVGRIWYPGPDEPNGSYEVESVSETSVVPAGTFEDCAMIFHDNPDSSSYSHDYLASGIGPVFIQSHIVDSSGSPAIEVDLSYELTSSGQ
jgi:hypothetical protein